MNVCLYPACQPSSLRIKKSGALICSYRLPRDSCSQQEKVGEVPEGVPDIGKVFLSFQHVVAATYTGMDIPLVEELREARQVLMAVGDAVMPLRYDRHVRLPCFLLSKFIARRRVATRSSTVNICSLIRFT